MPTIDMPKLPKSDGWGGRWRQQGWRYGDLWRVPPKIKPSESLFRSKIQSMSSVLAKPLVLFYE
jgi:hypothetical protein